jgi:probable HAF family extracellular repeat protein
MNTKNCLITILSSIALAACLAETTPYAHAQSISVTTYEVTDLEGFPEQKVAVSTPTAINTVGQVAGTAGRFAFWYDSILHGPMQKLSNSLPSNISRAFAMNDFDQVVGDSTFGAKDLISRAALFYQGSVIDLGVLDTESRFRNYSRANGINSSGQVVGFSGPKFDGSNSRAFIWSKATGMRDIGTLGGAYAQAFAINDFGFVTGNSQTKSTVGAVHAFIYDSFGPRESFWGMRDLGTFGGNYSYGTFINADNHVVGYSTTDKSDNRIHAFLYDGAKMRDLGSLGGETMKSDQSFALGVNGADEVVGYTYLAPSENVAASVSIQGPKQVAFLYNSLGVMMDLNDLIDTASKRYWLQSAVAINDKGQIAANALDYSTGQVHAVLLTPTGIYIDIDTN